MHNFSSVWLCLSCTLCTLHECFADLYKRQWGKEAGRCLGAHSQLSGFRILPPSESVNCCLCQVLPPRERCSFSFLSFLSFFAPPWLQQLLHWFSTLCSSCTYLILMMQETYTETRDVTDNGGNVFSCTYSLSYDPNTAKVSINKHLPFPTHPSISKGLQTRE